MRDYQIITDTCSDLSDAYCKKHDIGMIPTYYEMDGKLYGDTENMEYSEFYDKVRQGMMPTTMAINPQVTEKVFRSYLEKGMDVLYLGFSSALSSSYNVGAMTALNLSDEFPEAKIITVDTLAASLGEGLLVHLARELQVSGKTIEEVASWVEDNKLHLSHQFTVDNLFHLYRGGRVSRTSAILGTLAQVKPILHVDNEGRLIPIGKVKGRKKSLNALVDRMGETLGSFAGKNKIFFLGHGDCLEDAQYVADRVKERFGIEESYIDMISPTIGAHSGPGTIALFYLGDER